MMTHSIFILLCCCIALYESGIGLMQVLGLRVSEHAGFALTGTFSNPGPYGGCIAILLSILASYAYINRNERIRYIRFISFLSILSSMICILVFPASMSRAAWLAFLVAALIFAFRELKLSQWIEGNRNKSLLAAVILVGLLAGGFFLKKDSAIGRLHIWHMELRAIAKKPWSGHGKGSFLGVYGQTQAEYFNSLPLKSETIIKVAGCPEYAFNEYLKIGVEYGIPAMLIVIAILFFIIHMLVKRRSPIAYGLIVFCVFAFFSYPLNAIKLKTKEEKEWESIRFLSQMELYDEAVKGYAPLYESLKDNYKFMYDYGYALYKCNRYDESINILQEGAKMSSDPMFYNILGRNYEELHRYGEAKESYIYSHNMVPQRIYPLYLIMLMELRCNNTSEAMHYAKRIMRMPVNEKHNTMIGLRLRTEDILDSLRSINTPLLKEY